MSDTIIKVYCDNCESDTIYACVGKNEIYVCRNCYDLILSGKLSLLDIEEKKALRRTNQVTE